MKYGNTICYRDIGVRIMKLRKEKGYSREQLAELANISASFLYEIETSKKGLSVNSLVGLVEALEVSADYLLYGTVQVQCENSIFEMIRKFSSKDLQRVEKLLKIVYELIGNA